MYVLVGKRACNECRLSGDGAYLSMKSTAIGCFVETDSLGNGKPVNVGSSKGFSLSEFTTFEGDIK